MRAPSQTPSGHFCGGMTVSGTSLYLYREKTRLMISASLHGYAHTCMAGILAAKIRQDVQKHHLTSRITPHGCAVYCAAVRRWPGRQAWLDLLLRGSDLTWINQHAVMNGIRKGNPCGAAMYTSLTCLTLFTAEGSGSKQVANR